MSDLPTLLTEYHDLIQQIQLLETKKNELREAISALVRQQGTPASITVGDTEVRAVVRSSTKVEYDEVGLRERLGDRFRSILSPDHKKMRQHLAEIGPALEPFLDAVGSVSRERVAEQIESGSLSADDFAGLFKKTEKNTLIVKMIPMEHLDGAPPVQAGK